MALTKTEKKVLKEVRGSIENGGDVYLCIALGKVAWRDLNLRESCDKLRSFIEDVLEGHNTLEGWQRANGVKRPWCDWEQRRQDRLAWIDYLLSC